MEERINKPKVFLSHSKKNSEFIEKLASDLRKCQIEPWLDTDQIRLGKSWQDSIFEYGLPTCDAVIVYFTEISIQSSVVKKEIDVALLQNLKDNNIAFLPCVNDEKLRLELRPDIQALQVPEWNDKNYYLLLPRVVAEIWRSYLERMIAFAVKDERLKRMQLELELEKRQNEKENVFSPSEIKEFEYIFINLNQYVSVNVSKRFFFKSITNEIIKHTIKINLLSVVANLSNEDEVEYEYNHILIPVITTCRRILDPINPFGDDADLNHTGYDGFDFPNLITELQMFGLVETVAYNDNFNFKYILTKKYYRFRYWLAFNRTLPNEILAELES